MIIKTIDEIQIFKPKDPKLSSNKTVKYRTDYKGIVTETECEKNELLITGTDDEDNLFTITISGNYNLEFVYY